MRVPKPIHLASIVAALAFVLALAPNAAAKCGDFNDDGNITAVDALGVLNAAIGIQACEIYRCDVDGNGQISATDALRTLGMAVGTSQTALCPADPSECLNDIEFFFQRVWTPILTDCINCHNAQVLAANTDHVLIGATEDGYLEHNFTVLKTLHSLGKSDLLLTKPQGIAHGGGQHRQRRALGDP